VDVVILEAINHAVIVSFMSYVVCPYVFMPVLSHCAAAATFLSGGGLTLADIGHPGRQPESAHHPPDQQPAVPA